MAISALHVRTVVQNCTSATAEIAAICAKLSPLHRRRGRHFERFSRFSHSHSYHSYHFSSIIAFFYQPLTISAWLSALPPLLPTLPQKRMITDRDSHQKHSSHADFLRVSVPGLNHKETNTLRLVRCQRSFKCTNQAFGLYLGRCHHW